VNDAELEFKERVELAMKLLNGDKLTVPIKKRIHQLTGMSAIELTRLNTADGRKHAAENLIGRRLWVSPRVKTQGGREPGGNTGKSMELAKTYQEIKDSDANITQVKAIEATCEQLGVVMAEGTAKSYIRKGRKHVDPNEVINDIAESLQRAYEAQVKLK